MLKNPSWYSVDPKSIKSQREIFFFFAGLKIEMALRKFIYYIPSDNGLEKEKEHESNLRKKNPFFSARCNIVCKNAENCNNITKRGDACMIIKNLFLLFSWTLTELHHIYAMCALIAELFKWLKCGNYAVKMCHRTIKA